jgi:hypothetical protein
VNAVTLFASSSSFVALGPRDVKSQFHEVLRNVSKSVARTLDTANPCCDASDTDHGSLQMPS